MKFIEKIARDKSGSSVVTFGLLAGVVTLAYILSAGSVDCFCLEPKASGVVSLNTVERLFGSFLASL